MTANNGNLTVSTLDVPATPDPCAEAWAVAMENDGEYSDDSISIDGSLTAAVLESCRRRRTPERCPGPQRHSACGSGPGIRGSLRRVFLITLLQYIRLFDGYDGSGQLTRLCCCPGAVCGLVPTAKAKPLHTSMPSIMTHSATIHAGSPNFRAPLHVAALPPMHPDTTVHRTGLPIYFSPRLTIQRRQS